MNRYAVYALLIAAGTLLALQLPFPGWLRVTILIVGAIAFGVCAWRAVRG